MNETILHVDDDPDIRSVVSSILAGEGYKILSVNTVEEGIASLKNKLPRLIILDVMVEREDSGLSAFDDLTMRFPKIPVIILTTLGEMILPYFENNKDLVHIVEKPIIPEKLITTVRFRIESAQKSDQ